MLLLSHTSVVVYGMSANDKEACVARDNICVRIEVVVAGVRWWWSTTPSFAGLSPSRKVASGARKFDSD